MPDMTGVPQRHELNVITSKSSLSQIFQLPAPVKHIFDKFPLTTYPPNELPRRSPRTSDINVLHIFTTEQGAGKNAPSFNPTCLKWQTYLKICGVRFETVAANNHASPTGILPFLSPALTSGPPSSAQTIPSNKISKWATTQLATAETTSSIRYEAYISLIDHRLRSAWLFTLYLDDHNSRTVAKRLYIYPTSSNPLVQMTLHRQLRQAARDELLKARSLIKEENLYMEAEAAFSALSTLLGDDTNFFRRDRPSLFDASLFAYTHLLLDETMGWQTTRLADSLKKFPTLVRHRHRILEEYFDV